MSDSKLGEFFTKVQEWAKNNKLLIATVFGVVTGVWLGFAMRAAKFSDIRIYYWAFPGSVLMMNMLKCIIIPLITLSITTGVASLAHNSGKLSLVAVLYYLTTTVIAIILGIVMTVIVRPGKHANTDTLADRQSNQNRQDLVDGLLDIIRNMFSPNIVSAMFQQVATSRQLNADGSFVEPAAMNSPTWSGPAPTQNVLGLITFFSVFGFLLGKQAYKGNTGAQEALKMMNGLNDALMDLVDVIMCYVPIGLVFLISSKIMSISAEDGAIWTALGWLIFTSIVAILIHAFILIPTVYFVTTKKNPYVYMGGVSQAMITAFGNASSAATMPITLRNLETNNNIDKKVTRFMIPLGMLVHH